MVIFDDYLNHHHTN